MVKDKPLILIVDDEPHICAILRRILERERYRVITTPDGKTALQFIREMDIDLILLDLLMPGMDGREICRRSRDFSTKTRIVYFTAKVEPGLKNLKELRNEADAFITKPATSKQILSIVRKVLEDTR